MATQEVGLVTEVPVIEILDDDEEVLDNGVLDNPEENDQQEDEDAEENWEADSFYEEVFEQMGDEQECHGSNDACTREEATAYIRLLRTVGEHEFVRQTLEAGVKAKKLITAFGIPPPSWLEGSPDAAYYRLLGLGIERELQKRLKLLEYNTVDDAVSLLQKSHNIIVLTGAGISTSLGIPDFRSKNTGLYSKLAHLGLNDPQEVFDIEQFRDDPTVFYSVARDILPSTKKFSPTHAFIRLLQDKGKLLTNYTQNIDNLEDHAGIDSEKLVQCHGSFATASCQECRYQVKGDAIFADIKAGIVPRCSQCLYRMRQILPTGLKRKRVSDHPRSKSKRREDYEDSSSEEDFTQVAGIMKPDITFFGEGLPEKFGKRLVGHDKDLVDLVVVIGTSLKVAPVAEVPNLIKEIPQIYISRDPCKHVQFDIELMGECDVIVAELCRRAGWDLQHDMIPPNQVINVQLADHQVSRWAFTSSTSSIYPPHVGVLANGEGNINGSSTKVPPSGMKVKNSPSL